MAQVAELRGRGLDRRGMAGLKEETMAEIQRNANKAVASLDADQQLRLANMVANDRDWHKARREWES